MNELDEASDRGWPGGTWLKIMPKDGRSGELKFPSTVTKEVPMKHIKDKIAYDCFLEDPAVVTQANEIATSRKRAADTRTADQRLQHALNGSALEMAVRLELGRLGLPGGWEVLDPLDKTHDIRLKRRDGKIFKIDVKGRFSSASKTLTVSDWEVENADQDTVYLVFNCVDGEAEFAGWFSLWDLQEGRYGPFIWISALSKKNPFA